jgi:hypothetical protein
MGGKRKKEGGANGSDKPASRSASRMRGDEKEMRGKISL